MAISNNNKQSFRTVADKKIDSVSVFSLGPNVSSSSAADYYAAELINFEPGKGDEWVKRRGTELLSSPEWEFKGAVELTSTNLKNIIQWDGEPDDVFHFEDNGTVRVYYLKNGVIFDANGKAQNWYSYNEIYNWNYTPDNFAETGAAYNKQFENHGELVSNTPWKRVCELEDGSIENLVDGKCPVGEEKRIFDTLYPVEKLAPYYIIKGFDKKDLKITKHITTGYAIWGIGTTLLYFPIGSSWQTALTEDKNGNLINVPLVNGSTGIIEQTSNNLNSGKIWVEVPPEVITSVEYNSLNKINYLADRPGYRTTTFTPNGKAVSTSNLVLSPYTDGLGIEESILLQDTITEGEINADYVSTIKVDEVLSEVDMVPITYKLSSIDLYDDKFIAPTVTSGLFEVLENQESEEFLNIIGKFKNSTLSLKEFLGQYSINKLKDRKILSAYANKKNVKSENHILKQPPTALGAVRARGKTNDFAETFSNSFLHNVYEMFLSVNLNNNNILYDDLLYSENNLDEYEILKEFPYQEFGDKVSQNWITTTTSDLDVLERLKSESLFVVKSNSEHNIFSYEKTKADSINLIEDSINLFNPVHINVKDVSQLMYLGKNLGVSIYKKESRLEFFGEETNISVSSELFLGLDNVSTSLVSDLKLPIGSNADRSIWEGTREHRLLNKPFRTGIDGDNEHSDISRPSERGSFNGYWRTTDAYNINEVFHRTVVSRIDVDNYKYGYERYEVDEVGGVVTNNNGIYDYTYATSFGKILADGSGFEDMFYEDNSIVNITNIHTTENSDILYDTISTSNNKYSVVVNFANKNKKGGDTQAGFEIINEFSRNIGSGWIEIYDNEKTVRNDYDYTEMDNFPELYAPNILRFHGILDFNLNDVDSEYKQSTTVLNDFQGLTSLLTPNNKLINLFIETIDNGDGTTTKRNTLTYNDLDNIKSVFDFKEDTKDITYKSYEKVVPKFKDEVPAVPFDDYILSTSKDGLQYINSEAKGKGIITKTPCRLDFSQFVGNGTNEKLLNLGNDKILVYYTEGEKVDRDETIIFKGAIIDLNNFDSSAVKYFEIDLKDNPWFQEFDLVYKFDSSSYDVSYIDDVKIDLNLSIIKDVDVKTDGTKILIYAIRKNDLSYEVSNLDKLANLDTLTGIDEEIRDELKTIPTKIENMLREYPSWKVDILDVSDIQEPDRELYGNLIYRDADNLNVSVITNSEINYKSNVSTEDSTLILYSYGYINNISINFELLIVDKHVWTPITGEAKVNKILGDFNINTYGIDIYNNFNVDLVSHSIFNDSMTEIGDFLKIGYTHGDTYKYRSQTSSPVCSGGYGISKYRTVTDGHKPSTLTDYLLKKENEAPSFIDSENNPISSASELYYTIPVKTLTNLIFSDIRGKVKTSGVPFENTTLFKYDLNILYTTSMTYTKIDNDYRSFTEIGVRVLEFEWFNLNNNEEKDSVINVLGVDQSVYTLSTEKTSKLKEFLTSTSSTKTTTCPGDPTLVLVTDTASTYTLVDFKGEDSIPLRDIDNFYIISYDNLPKLKATLKITNVITDAVELDVTKSSPIIKGEGTSIDFTADILNYINTLGYTGIDEIGKDNLITTLELAYNDGQSAQDVVIDDSYIGAVMNIVFDKLGTLPEGDTAANFPTGLLNVEDSDNFYKVNVQTNNEFDILTQQNVTAVEVSFDYSQALYGTVTNVITLKESEYYKTVGIVCQAINDKTTAAYNERPAQPMYSVIPSVVADIVGSSDGIETDENGETIGFGSGMFNTEKGVVSFQALFDLSSISGSGYEVFSNFFDIDKLAQNEPFRVKGIKRIQEDDDGNVTEEIVNTFADQWGYGIPIPTTSKDSTLYKGGDLIQSSTGNRQYILNVTIPIKSSIWITSSDDAKCVISEITGECKRIDGSSGEEILPEQDGYSNADIEYIEGWEPGMLWIDSTNIGLIGEYIKDKTISFASGSLLSDYNYSMQRNKLTAANSNRSQIQSITPFEDKIVVAYDSQIYITESSSPTKFTYIVENIPDYLGKILKVLPFEGSLMVFFEKGYCTYVPGTTSGGALTFTNPSNIVETTTLINGDAIAINSGYIDMLTTEGVERIWSYGQTVTLEPELTSSRLSSIISNVLVRDINKAVKHKVFSLDNLTIVYLKVPEQDVNTQDEVKYINRWYIYDDNKDFVIKSTNKKWYVWEGDVLDVNSIIKVKDNDGIIRTIMSRDSSTDILQLGYTKRIDSDGTTNNVLDTGSRGQIVELSGHKDRAIRIKGFNNDYFTGEPIVSKLVTNPLGAVALFDQKWKTYTLELNNYGVQQDYKRIHYVNNDDTGTFTTDEGTLAQDVYSIVYENGYWNVVENKDANFGKAALGAGANLNTKATFAGKAVDSDVQITGSYPTLFTRDGTSNIDENIVKDKVALGSSKGSQFKIHIEHEDDAPFAFKRIKMTLKMKKQKN